jgi:hypothetical protein
MMMDESESEEFERPPKDRMIIIGILSFIMSILITGITGAEPIVGIVFYSGGIFFWGLILGTEEGRNKLREIWKESREQNTQQQMRVGSNSEPTKICSECGWKNSKSNQYCNDCGFSFDSGEGDE